jgi:tetratricopeptide (TPR) repeat protein
VRLVLKEMRETGDSSLATDFLGYGQACADALPKGDAEAKQLLDASIDRLREVLAKKDAPLAADDRSDAMANLADLLDQAGRHDEAVKTMEERAALLEKAAAAAPDASMASTFDAHRVDTYIYLNQVPKAERLLVQREREIPSDYNVPARLARVYFEEKKVPEAEAEIDRALAMMPRSQRRIGILGLKAKILKAGGKPVEHVVREQLDVLRSLPQPQRSPEQEKKLEEQLKTAAR